MADGRSFGTRKKITYVTSVTTMKRTIAHRTRLIRYRSIEPPPPRGSLYKRRRRPCLAGASEVDHRPRPAPLLQSQLAEVDFVDGRLDDRLRVDPSREEVSVVSVVDPSDRSPRAHDPVVEV